MIAFTARPKRSRLGLTQEEPLMKSKLSPPTTWELRAVALTLIALYLSLCLPRRAAAQLKITTQGEQSQPSPYQLTTQDGVGLKLIALKAKAIVDGPLAFTELHLTFKNPHPRQIEGRFEVTMPDRAAISRFAMKIKGQWMEGEVVEKQAARRAYEDALHRRQDPALLEQDAGNQFRARVFPIMAHEEKELIISWSHELKSAHERYSLPLVGLPKIERLELSALVAKTEGSSSLKSSLGGDSGRFELTKVSKRSFTPQRDWTLRGGSSPSLEGMRSADVALAKVTMPSASLSAVADSHMLILFDSSASTMIGYQERLKRLESLIARLSGSGVKALSLIAFDQEAEQLFHGSIEGFGPAQLKALKERGALGASSLAVGLKAAVEALAEGTQKGLMRRVLLVSDGHYTFGPSSPGALQTLLKEQLNPQGVRRIDALVEQSARDLSALEAIVSAQGFEEGAVLSLDMSEDQWVKRLSMGGFGSLKVSIPGAKWTWPSSLKGLQPGDQALIFASLPPSEPLKVTLSGGALNTPLEFSIEAREGDPALLERAWIRARIERLLSLIETEDPDMKGALRQQVIKLSTQHRVLSPYTALLVLENEGMYRRFGIDRNALSDVLTVGATGLERSTPTPLKLSEPKPRVSRPKRARRTRKRRPRGRRVEHVPVEVAASSPPLLDADETAASPSFDSPPAPAPEAESELPEAESEPREVRLSASEPPSRSGRGARLARRARPARSVRAERSDSARAPRQPALTGEMAKISAALKRGNGARALKLAERWRLAEPLNPLTLIALGQALSATGQLKRAARAFGSLIDFFPSRADMRRQAANWLETLDQVAQELVIDCYQQAAEQRPDHPSIYHMLAIALLESGRFEEALEVALRGLSAQYARGRFNGIERILREDAALIASAWLSAEPKRKAEIKASLERAQVTPDERPSLRFILSWETDANDVDFHIYDAKGNHAYYSSPRLASGGELYADITTGYGPECFTIYEPSAAPYRLEAHYYRRGPMGYGGGRLQIIRHDGSGRMHVTERPFVIMNDGAFVELGEVSAKALRSTR